MAINAIKFDTVPFVYDKKLAYLEIIIASFANVIQINCLVIVNQNANPTIVKILMSVGLIYSFSADFLFFESNI